MLAALPGRPQAADACKTKEGRADSVCESARRIAQAPRAGASVATPRPQLQAKRTSRECRSLHDAIADSEQVERRSGPGMIIESIQQDLLNLRKRYRQLGC